MYHTAMVSIQLYFSLLCCLKFIRVMSKLYILVGRHVDNMKMAENKDDNEGSKKCLRINQYDIEF
jgi:hypothetical protein